MDVVRGWDSASTPCCVADSWARLQTCVESHAQESVFYTQAVGRQEGGMGERRTGGADVRVFLVPFASSGPPSPVASAAVSSSPRDGPGQATWWVS